MAGVAYFRAHNLLREQAVEQSENLIVTQLNVVNQNIKGKEDRLRHLIGSSDFSILFELAIHANPKGNEFKEIRQNVLEEFENLNREQSAPAFDQFILMDIDGNVKVASNTDWEGKGLADLSFLTGSSVDHPSTALYNLPPFYENAFVLVTSLEYKTSRGSSLGYLIGITEPKQTQDLLRPLLALAPLAKTYFVLPSGQFLTFKTDTNEIIPADALAQSETDAIFSTLTSLQQNAQTQPKPLEIETGSDNPVLTQVQWFPSMHAGVVLEVDTTSVYSGLNSLAPFTVGLVLVTLLAVSLVIYLLINRFTKPLRGLAEITQQFAAGNWYSRAPVQSEDEVGQLASAYNTMAEELSRMYRSLENKVDESSRQIRTTAEIAQHITSFANLDAMLNQTVELLVHQFGFYQASIFLLDRTGQYLEFKTGYGAATQALSENKFRLPVGSDSITGWVSASNEMRIVSDTKTDKLQLTLKLLPETRSEAALPISVGSLVLGVLDIQSTKPDAFNAETIAMLQTLSRQAAAAIQTAGMAESSQVNFDELSRLYRSSHLIARAGTEGEILQIAGRVLQESPHTFIVLSLNNLSMEAISASDENGISILNKIPKSTAADMTEINRFLQNGTVVLSSENDIPSGIRLFIQPLKFDSTAIIPISKLDKLVAILVLGSHRQFVSNAFVQPYENFADLISISLEKTDAEKQTEKHLKEVESLASISEAISTSSDLPSFFTALHEKVREAIGDYSFIVALYDGRSNTISVPFSYENNQFISIDPFPLGEGLTSILIKSAQPLLLLEDTEQKAAELGAKIQGNPAKSWMGAPMLVENKPVGALIIQDAEKENAFTREDFIFFTTLAGQAAGVINNVRLLDESKNRALQLETAAEIARDISGSLNLDELLIKAVNLIRERFDFYHAAVFLQDLAGEFALIREATGEAGAQLKRAGHKIGVGSKSIVGFATGRGERLVVNDTSKDATYYANPLLPDTRAEAALPLKVGERILGALDVQSTRPYDFTEDNLRSLQILADQMAIAVVNTELFAETQEHLSQHRLLHHITATAASGTTLEEALDSAVQGLQVTLGGDRVSILLADREKKQLEIMASMGYAEDITNVRIAIGTGITGWAAANRKTLRVRDVLEDSRYIQVSSNTRSELAIPLIYRNELLGILNVESEQVDAYTENDEEMLGTLGGSLAAIIANARLLEQIRQQAERERVIYEVTSKIRRSTDIQSILTTTASELTRITGAQQTKIKITSGGKNRREGQ